MKWKLKLNTLLLGIIILFAFEAKGGEFFSQQKASIKLEGEWILEHAEYIIRSNIQDNPVEQKIYSDNLEKITSCENFIPTRIIIGDIVQVETPFGSYCGRASWEDLNEGRYYLTVGIDADDLGKESPIPGLYFNICSLLYSVEIIDSAVISITTKTYCEMDSGTEEGIVTCLLRKNN